MATLKKTKNGFKDRLSLNAGQKYCRMLQREHSAYFRASLSYQLSLSPLFFLFLNGRFTQVLHPFYCILSHVQMYKHGLPVNTTYTSLDLASFEIGRVKKVSE